MIHLAFCFVLSPEGLITAVKLQAQNSHNKLNSLRIHGIYGIQTEHLHTLRNLIGNHINHTIEQKGRRILYHAYRKSPAEKQMETGNGWIDVDVCPNCNDLRMVFDCPRDGCRCRGCELCITRCVECGICVGSDQELKEVLCADALCLECWLKGPKCNFCNKPCLHAHLQHRVGGSEGFCCDACFLEF